MTLPRAIACPFFVFVPDIGKTPKIYAQKELQAANSYSYFVADPGPFTTVTAVPLAKPHNISA